MRKLCLPTSGLHLQPHRQPHHRHVCQARGHAGRCRASRGHRHRYVGDSGGLLTFERRRHLVCSRSLFGTTISLIENHIKRFGIEVSFVSQTDLQEWRDVVQPNTKMFFLETPSNPLNEVADLEALTQIAHDAGALLVVDNTFLTPLLQQPLQLGADISLHSATKAIDGKAACRAVWWWGMPKK